MKTITTTLYAYDELSETAKQSAIEGLYYINVDHDWWDCEYEDAANVLLKLTSFDLDRNRYCEGEFVEGADDTANKIIAEHGKHCETYITASNYLADRAALVTKYSDGVDTDTVAEDDEYDFDDDCAALDAEFLKSILEDYSIILQNQYEFLVSEEAIIETIEANDYYFTEDGKLS